MNRRERQVQGRRQDILNAALILFENRGYSETSMEEIAASADVARGTLYNHFESKADVLLALTGQISQEWLSTSSEAVEKFSATQAIIKLLVTAAEWFDKHPGFAAPFYHAIREVMARHDMKSPPPILVPKELTTKAQQNNELTSELSAEMCGMLFDTILRNHMISWVRGTASGAIAPLVQKDAEVLLQRLRPK
jgi:AcrR family transcriptional regulator